MNNKGADQTAQMRRLICTFVVRMINRLSYDVAHMISGEQHDESINPNVMECLGQKYGIPVLFCDVEVNILTSICLVDSSILINWMSLLPILGVSGVLFSFFFFFFFLRNLC